MEAESPKFLIKTGFRAALIVSGADPTGFRAVFKRFGIDFTNLTIFIKLGIGFNNLVLGVTLAGSKVVSTGFRAALTDLEAVTINLGAGLIVAI